jgi:hypothetical protein
LRARKAARASLLALALAGAGCRERPSSPPTAGSAASARPKPSATTTPPPRASAQPPTVIGCRVLAAKGAGAPSVGTLLTGSTWVDLAAGVEVSLKHTETARELRVRGPARMLACPEGAETLVLARGGVSSIPGPGARAGASVMLATPFGVVEYADAELTLEVVEEKLTLDVARGSASVGASIREDRPGAPPAKPVQPPLGRVTLSGKVQPPALATRCSEARDSVTLGTAEPAPSAAVERGRWAVGMMAKRKGARLICARAHAAAGRLDGPERSLLEDQLTGRKSPAPGSGEPSAKAGADAGK